MKKVLFALKTVPFLRRVRYVFLPAALFASVITCTAQDSTISVLLKKIQGQQIVSDPYFVESIFPSYICDAPLYCQRKKDNNVFYNALIGYTLHKLWPDLSEEDQLIADRIQVENHDFFPRFRNAKGRLTYNFERTDTAFTYPYSNWIPKLRGGLEFPDDLDCTALVLLADEVTDSTAEQVHQLMQNYVNKGINKTTYRSYRTYPAYSSWFGKKFPVVFDVSVLCNILCFVQENNLKWTAADSASLKLIVNTIERNDHAENPRFVSPYYPKQSLVLYHLSRLMAVKPIPELESLKQKFITQALEIIASSDNTLERVVLNSALLKWGAATVDIGKSNEQLLKEVHDSDFSFFAGNIPSYLKQPWKGILTSAKAVQYYHYCNAFNDVLLLEYLVLEKKRKK